MGRDLHMPVGLPHWYVKEHLKAHLSQAYTRAFPSSQEPRGGDEAELLQLTDTPGPAAHLGPPAPPAVLQHQSPLVPDGGSDTFLQPPGRNAGSFIIIAVSLKKLQDHLC